MWILIGIILVIVAGYIYLTSYKKGTDKYVDKIQTDKISPDMNRFAARKETTAAQARTGLAEALTRESEAVTEMHHVTARTEEARNLEQATNENQIAVLNEATPQGLNPITYLAVKQKQLMDEQERIHQSRSVADRIRLGIIAKYLQEHQGIIELQVILDQMYEEVHRIEMSDEPESVKRRKIAAREESIKAIEEDKRGRESRLLRVYQREELGAGDPDSLLLGDTEE